MLKLVRAIDCWGNRSIYASNMLDIGGGIVWDDPKKLAVFIQKIIAQNKVEQ
ncbi:MAG: hypothetical protein R6T98_16740 [Desulfatiglandales bacterium]